MRASSKRRLVVKCSAGCGRVTNQALVDAVAKVAAFCASCRRGRGKRGEPNCTGCNKPGHYRPTCKKPSVASGE